MLVPPMMEENLEMRLNPILTDDATALQGPPCFAKTRANGWLLLLNIIKFTSQGNYFDVA